MTLDDWKYVFLLMFSIPFGFLMRQISGFQRKQILSSGVGLLMVLIVCKLDALHAVLTTVVNALIVIHVSPKSCHIVSFVWCFGYILFFRTTYYFGLPTVTPHANAVQLLLTLKLVGVAFEVRDSSVRNDQQRDEKRWDEKQPADKQRDDAAQLERHYKNVRPSFADILLYSSCYIGILTGPYYKYRTYVDMLRAPTAHLNLRGHMRTRLKWIPVVGAAYLLLSHYITIEYVRSDESFYQQPFLYRLGYAFPMFTVFRLRMYFAWLMSEVVCMAAALGAYPAASKPKVGQGPTDLAALKECEARDPGTIQVDFETVHNIDMAACDCAPTVREAMRGWNMSVQYWLAHHVYRRLPIRPLRTVVTMAVSAFWHGVHPGYYLSFITIPPALLAEEAMAAAFRRPDNMRRYSWFAWFWRMRWLEAMSMGFLLLRGDSTLRYWSSTYFLPHLSILAFICVGNLFRKKREGLSQRGSVDSTASIESNVSDLKSE